MFPEAAAYQMLVPSESKQRLPRGETQGISATPTLRGKKDCMYMLCGGGQQCDRDAVQF